MRLLAAAALLLVAPLGAAFYLPGLAPVSFCEEGEETESCKVRARPGGPGPSLCPARGSRGEGIRGVNLNRAARGCAPAGGSLCSGHTDTLCSYSLFPLDFPAALGGPLAPCSWCGRGLSAAEGNSAMG